MLKSLLAVFLFCTITFGQIPQNIPVNLKQISLTTAIGVPNETPRSLGFALGIAQQVSTNQDWFFDVMLVPKPVTTNKEERIIIGLTQNLGSSSFGGLKFNTWISAAMGGELSAASKLQIASNSTTGFISIPTTNTAFTTEIVIGAGHKSGKYEWGPVARFIQTPVKQTLVGIYLKWGL